MPTPIAETGLLTAVTLTIIAILAIITALGIVRGMRLKRERAAADRIEEAGAEDEADQVIETATTFEPAVPAGSAPVAAASPPVGDAPEADAPAPVLPLADEPVPAASLDAYPTNETAPESAWVPQPAPDRPVTDIKGLGPKVATRLAELGITHVAQIAALDAGEAERLDAQLGPFTGRMARDRWIEQARFLAAGDVTGFEAVFGRL